MSTDQTIEATVNEVTVNKVTVNEVTVDEERSIPSEGEQVDTTSEGSLETNHQLLLKSEPFEPAINIPEDLYKNIKLKLNVLSRRDKIIQIKLAKYQKKNENLNMFIIFVSSILGIYETFRVKIDDIVKSQFVDVSTNVIPIILSGIITCTASIIKLKKYQEKSDNIHLTREKVSVARANLKTVQEHLLFCKSKEDLQKIKKIYFNNAFSSYCAGNAYLDKYVKEVDYHKYGTRINYSNGIVSEQDKSLVPGVEIQSTPGMSIERQSTPGMSIERQESISV